MHRVKDRAHTLSADPLGMQLDDCGAQAVLFEVR